MQGSHPGLPGGNRITAHTEFLDVYPTLCELADRRLHRGKAVFSSQASRVEFYDCEKDPLERQNLAGKTEYAAVGRAPAPSRPAAAAGAKP